MDEAQKKRILRQRLKKAELAQEEAERKLAIANATIFKQIEHIKKLDKFVEFKEKEARLQDNAIDRNNTIIHYLESKIIHLISDFNKA
jgi:hypothetical protein